MLVDSTELVSWPIDCSSSIIKKKKSSPKTYGSHRVNDLHTSTQI